MSSTVPCPAGSASAGGDTVLPRARSISWVKMSGSPVMHSRSANTVQIRLVHLWTQCHFLIDDAFTTALLQLDLGDAVEVAIHLELDLRDVRRGIDLVDLARLPAVRALAR